ncbi:MAG: Elongation factor Ts [Mycoplasmataceae bacterium]|nr:MAG: Elongation factor Ts [Mycoplasmataceae bacterium]
MSNKLENLKNLREITGVGIRDCIKALDANDNDLQKSIEWIRARSLTSSKSSNISDNDKSNKFGLAKIKNNGNKVVAFSLKCESDFVAMNSNFLNLAENISDLFLDKFDILLNSENLNKSSEEISKDLISQSSYSLKEKIYIENTNLFSKDDNDVFGSYTHHNKKIASFVILENGDDNFAREISMQIVANNPLFLSKDSIPSILINSKIEDINKEVYIENEGRSPEIIEKIINGRINKWLSEICFLEQGDFRNPTLKIKDILDSKNSKIKHFSLIDISK